MTSCSNHRLVNCTGGRICLSCQRFESTDGKPISPSYRTPKAVEAAENGAEGQRRPIPGRLAWGNAARSVTFELPLPLPKCSSNARNCGHWSVAAKDRKAYRAECLALLPRIDYMFGQMFTCATIRTEWFLATAPGRYHPRDAQNAISSLKSALDSIVEAGYLTDDSNRYLTWGETILHSAKESAGRACVVVILEWKDIVAK